MGYGDATAGKYLLRDRVSQDLKSAHELRILILIFESREIPCGLGGAGQNRSSVDCKISTTLPYSKTPSPGKGNLGISLKSALQFRRSCCSDSCSLYSAHWHKGHSSGRFS